VQPGPDGVRDARRLASAALDGRANGLAADAELVVTELVTNAVLHGAPPVLVRITGRRHRVRIEVSDSATTLPLRHHRRSEGMTGRGLDVVETLSHAWGVQSGPEGKLVWAELGRPRRFFPSRSDYPDAEAATLSELDSGADKHYPVRLGWVPTELLLAAKAHIDNILRELTLIREGAEAGLPADTIDMLATVTQDFAEARIEIKRQALAAARRGEVYTDLTLSLPLTAADAGIRYLAALDEADRQARSARLLTVAAAPSHRVFREWYVRSLCDQLKSAAMGEAPHEATTFALVLAHELDRMAARVAPSEAHYRYPGGTEA
jgi:hypothetical protein